MSKKVKCNDCIHERGIGFDAWCNLGLKHHLNDLHTCEAFYSREKYKDNINNTFTDFEFKNGDITLWKRHPIAYKDIGYKFTKQEFLTFLSSNIRRKQYWKQEKLISEQAIQLDYLKDENRHMSEVLDENKQLKQQLHKKEEEITFLNSTNMELEDANARLEEKNIELQERNDRQYDKLTHLWGCIRNKDYETLQKEWEEIEEADKKLQEEWKCY